MKMKKKLWMSLLGCLLTLSLALPALATTAVSIDDKIYTFPGDAAVQHADGKTFLFEGNTVRVREEGKADRELTLTEAQGATMVEDTVYVPRIDAVSGTAAEIVAEPARDISLSNRGDYDQYAPFGLSYDSANDVLYYQGQRVRVFSDDYAIDDYSHVAIEHFDEKGTVDVRAERDLTIVRNEDGSYDPGGRVTGLRALSDAEFAARDLTSYTSPSQPRQSTAVSGEPMSPKEMEDFYAPYAALGITYNPQTDLLTYQGQTIRRFLDVRQSNGEPFASGRFQGSMTSFTQEGGQIDLTILRDYSQPDAEGNGKIIGVQVESR